MSNGLDYAKAKRRARGPAGEQLPGRWNTGRWRVEWPEQFPVVVTQLVQPGQAGPGQQPEPTVAA